MALVSAEIEGQSAIRQIVCPAQVFEAGERVAPGENSAGFIVQAQPFADSLLAQLVGALVGVGRGIINRPVRLAVAIVIDHQGALVASAIGVGKDVFVHLAVVRKEVVEQEVAALGKEPAALEQRGNLAFVALDHPGIGVFVVARPLVLHAVLLGEALDLAVAEHRQAGQRGHHRRNAKAFIALAELIDGRALVGIAHEVHVALHDVGVELQRVLDDRTVLGVVLVAQHHHEGAVVNAMHAQRANEVALH